MLCIEDFSHLSQIEGVKAIGCISYLCKCQFFFVVVEDLRYDFYMSDEPFLPTTDNFLDISLSIFCQMRLFFDKL